MTRWIIITGMISLLLAGCSQQSGNPLLQEWKTPFGVPPVDKIEVGHYVPAYKVAMAEHKTEIDNIVNNTEAPTFQNTIEALDAAGGLLSKVSNVFGVLNSVITTDEMQATARTLSPLTTKHYDDIKLNSDLFKRVKAVYEQKESLDLNGEQMRLLEERYKNFIRGGANLSDDKKAELRIINEKVGMLSLEFGENLLKETNAFELVIDNKEDLDGLTEGIIQGAAETATTRGHEGKWVFTTHRPSMYPFLTYSTKRNLREILYKAYINRGNNNNEADNNAILSELAALRVKRANIMGFNSHADFIISNNMAQTPKAVYDLLGDLWKPTMKMAKREVKAMQKIIKSEGHSFKLQSWDWWNYAEKVKKAKYDLDEAEIRPYFKLEYVREGAFMVANKLWGLTFTERHDIPVYHEEVKVFEVKEADGSHVGILYTDYFPRATKRGGAWMNSFRKQHKGVTPVITNNGNFTRPVGDTPSLLSFDEATTLFHEFGHALHGLLSKCTYNSLSGTSVKRDFVELPSQIMENWASHPEVMKLYAKHYETGEAIPQELINKIEKASHFNQGFITGEYLAASFLDMDWHSMTESIEHDPTIFENKAMKRIKLIDEIIPRYRSTYFSHIFAGGYSAGYYVYIWAAVLDTDAFGAFEEKGLFDQATAASLRENIFSKGNSKDPMELFKTFRGREPKVDFLLAKRGLK
ncbi:M3 family metallopeptidase [bacterium]|nr:M3 family metallopeptidase [bacterium]